MSSILSPGGYGGGGGPLPGPGGFSPEKGDQAAAAAAAQMGLVAGIPGMDNATKEFLLTGGLHASTHSYFPFEASPGLPKAYRGTNDKDDDDSQKSDDSLTA